MRESTALRSAVLLLTALFTLGWGISHLETISDLRATQRPQEFHPASATVVAEHGVGPLRIDVLQQFSDGPTFRVAPPPGGHPIAGQRREVRIGDEGGAYYPTAPPRDGLWVRFALAAAASLLAAVAMAVVAIRPLGQIVFGQRDPGAKSFGWLPGHGSHGGTGGQTPPYVPYNPDWDPKNRRGSR